MDSATPTINDTASVRPDVDAIRARADAATKGPWRWFGYTDGDIYLATTWGGRRFVLGGTAILPTPDPDYDVDVEDEPPLFSLGDLEPCHIRVQPTFQVYDGKSGLMRPAGELAVPEVDYRNDVDHIDNPDAQFIANARADVDALLAYVDELEARLGAAG